MEIKNKFELGDRVYVIYGKKILEGKIEQVKILHQKYLSAWELPEVKESTEISYMVRMSILKPIEYSGIYVEELYEEDDVYPSLEALIANLV